MPSIFRSIKSVFKDFCENTTLHGLRYIYNNKRNKNFKSALWISLCMCSTIFCVYLIQLQLEEYQAKRIVTVISNAVYPIWNFPFPAVTVCGFNAVYRESALPIANLL